MDIASAGVFLQGGNPDEINDSALNPLAQGGNLLNLGQQLRGNYELREIGHGKNLFQFALLTTETLPSLYPYCKEFNVIHTT
jgi:hypothetical protein